MENTLKKLFDAKLRYISNAIIFTAIGLFLISISNFLRKDYIELALSAVSFLACLLSYRYIKIKATYFIPSLVLIIIGYVLATCNFVSNYRYENIIEVLWYANLTLAAFYTLGRKIGAIFLAIFAITIVVVKICIMNHYFDFDISNTDAFNEIEFAVGALVSAAILGFLFSQAILDNNNMKSELIAINKKIVRQNNEKTLMLNEIHHRVKNNLQVISSLLRLQMYNINESYIREPFEESINRISTMALIHSKMYQNEFDEDLQLELYLNELISDLLKANCSEKEINLSITTTVKHLKFNDLIPFSLIVNELVTNTLKHGFKNLDKGDISLNISESDELFTFTYQDSGKWIPPKSESSFGLELIGLLTARGYAKFGKNKLFSLFFLDFVYPWFWAV